ncbi:SHOCT domain-containing protein [Actinophytocola algeriensis]|nr:SHOCT domain-containing protein [Actinophytocola algeriensis]
MTWQEELRQLDSALAGGELSANEYRKRRDEILAAASSAQPPSPLLGAPAEPPPAQADNGDQAGDQAEVTQIVNVEESEADQTQIIDAATMTGVKAGGNGNGGDNNADADAERTQAVAAKVQPALPAQPAAQQPAPQQAAPQQPVWATQLPEPNASAGMYPPPPQAIPGMPGPTVTPHDAQDLFTSNKPPRGSKKPLLIGLVVLVVLALAGGAVWFFGFSGDDDPQNTAEQTSTPAEPAPEPVDITKIELPGKPADNGGEMDIARAGELKVLAPAEAALIADAGADTVVYSGTAEGDYRYLLYAYNTADQKAAEELTGNLLDIQKQLGFEDTEVGEVPDSVHVSTVSNPQASAMRGVYTYGDTTIQLSVLQVPAGGIDELRVQFQRAMTAVTDAAPPGN